MKITIGGVSGTGKSSVSRRVAETLGYKRYSGGDIQRMNAQARNMTIEDYDQFLITHPELDREIEDRQRTIGESEDNFVLESRIGWYAVPDAIKIKLHADLDERIKRITGDTSGRIAHSHGDFEDTMKKTIEREATYEERFNELYGIDDWNHDKHFDLVVDTTHISMEQVIEKILDYINSVNKKESD